MLNGNEINNDTKDGYVSIKNNWSGENIVELELEMDVKVIEANPLVRENEGKVAISRGSIVYCLEEEDNGDNLHLIHLCEDRQFDISYEKELLDGIVVIKSKGVMVDVGDWDMDVLYSSDKLIKYVNKELKWIPYYSWANRNPGEMIVWVKK